MYNKAIIQSIGLRKIVAHNTGTVPAFKWITLMNYTIPTRKFNLWRNILLYLKNYCTTKNVFTEVVMHGGSHNSMQFL